MSNNTMIEKENPTTLWEDVLQQHHFLVLPGYQNSGPGHWQSIWERLHPGKFTRVVQDDWENPMVDQWTRRIDEYVEKAEAPVVLIGHSLGSNAAVHWALTSQWVFKVSGLLLVAPADTDHSLIPAVHQFSSVPLEPLPVKSIVVASINDPHAVISRQAAFAAYWGSKFKTVGNKGHINALSGLDAWQEGIYYLEELLEA